jgi:hypothetical protein
LHTHPQQEARESGYTGYDPTKAIEKKKVPVLELDRRLAY